MPYEILNDEINNCILCKYTTHYESVKQKRLEFVDINILLYFITNPDS